MNDQHVASRLLVLAGAVMAERGDGIKIDEPVT